MITGEIKSQIDKIWESFWTGGVSNPLTVIEQFTYLLFIRRLDETQIMEEKKANMIKKPVSNVIFTPAQQELRWSSFKNKDPETMFDLFNRPTAGSLSVFEHMKQVGDAVGVFAHYMKGATFMIPTPRLLDQVVQMIDKIKMEDRDTKGDVYEYLLSKIATAGTNGQFRTPRHIIRMMVDMVEPTKEDTICDPSAGTAGFLVSAGEYMHEKHPDWFHEKQFREHYNSNMFTGIEFDNTMLRIGAMNLQLHGFSSSQIIKAVSTVFKQINLNIDKKISFSTAKKYIKMVYKMNDISVRIGDKVETHYNLEKYKPFSELKKNRKTKSATKSNIITVGL